MRNWPHSCTIYSTFAATPSGQAELWMYASKKEWKVRAAPLDEVPLQLGKVGCDVSSTSPDPLAEPSALLHLSLCSLLPITVPAD